MKVDVNKFKVSYKQYKKDIKLLKSLIEKFSYRYKWFKKRNLPIPSIEELEQSLKRCENDKQFMERFIERR